MRNLFNVLAILLVTSVALLYVALTVFTTFVLNHL